MSIDENPWEKLDCDSQLERVSHYLSPFKALKKSPLLENNLFSGLSDNFSSFEGIIQCKICAAQVLSSRYSNHYRERHSSQESYQLKKVKKKMILEDSKMKSQTIPSVTAPTTAASKKPRNKRIFSEEENSDENTSCLDSEDNETYSSLFSPSTTTHGKGRKCDSLTEHDILQLYKSTNSDECNRDKLISESLMDLSDYEFLEEKSFEGIHCRDGQNGFNYRFNVDSLPWEIEDMSGEGRLMRQSCDKQGDEVNIAVASITYGKENLDDTRVEKIKPDSFSEEELALFLNSDRNLPLSPQPTKATATTFNTGPNIDSTSLIDEFATEKFPFLSSPATEKADESHTSEKEPPFLPTKESPTPMSLKSSDTIDADAERMIALIHNKLMEKKQSDTDATQKDFNSTAQPSQQFNNNKRSQNPNRCKKPNSIDNVPLHLRPFDPRLHCGVVKDGVMCRRSLLCKIHSMGLKRQVARPGDVNSLMKELREANRIKRLRLNAPSVIPQPNTNMTMTNCIKPGIATARQPILIQTSNSHLFTPQQSVSLQANQATNAAKAGNLAIFTTPNSSQNNFLTLLHHPIKGKNNIITNTSPKFLSYDNNNKSSAKPITISQIQKSIPIVLETSRTQDNINLSNNSRDFSSCQTIASAHQMQSSQGTVIFATTTTSPSKNTNQITTTNCIQKSFSSQIPILMKCPVNNTVYSTPRPMSGQMNQSSPNTITASPNSSAPNSSPMNSSNCYSYLHDSSSQNLSDRKENGLSNSNWCIITKPSQAMTNSEHVYQSPITTNSNYNQSQDVIQTKGNEVNSYMTTHNPVSSVDMNMVTQMECSNKDTLTHFDETMTKMLNISETDCATSDNDTDGFIQEILQQDYMDCNIDHAELNSADEAKPKNIVDSTANAKSDQGANHDPTTSLSHMEVDQSPNSQSIFSGNLPTSSSPPSSNASSANNTENSGSFLTLDEWKELQKNSQIAADKDAESKEDDQEFVDDIHNLLESISTKDVHTRTKTGRKSSKILEAHHNTYLRVGNKKIKLSPEDLDKMLRSSQVKAFDDSNEKDEEFLTKSDDEKKRKEKNDSASSNNQVSLQKNDSQLQLLLYEDPNNDSNAQNYARSSSSQSYTCENSVDSSTTSNYLPRIESNQQAMNIPTAIVAPTTVTSQNDTSMNLSAYIKPINNQQLICQSDKPNMVNQNLSIAGHHQIVLNNSVNLNKPHCHNNVGYGQLKSNNSDIIEPMKPSRVDSLSYCNENLYEEAKKNQTQPNNNQIDFALAKGQNITQMTTNQSNLKTLQFQKTNAGSQIIDSNLKGFYGGHQIHLIPTSAFKGGSFIMPSINGQQIQGDLSSMNQSCDMHAKNSSFYTLTGFQTQNKSFISHNTTNGSISCEGKMVPQFAFLPDSTNGSTLMEINQASGIPSQHSQQQQQQQQQNQLTNSNQTTNILTNQQATLSQQASHHNMGQQQFNIIMAPKPQQYQYFQKNALPNNPGTLQFFRLSNGQIISGVPSNGNYIQSLNHSSPQVIAQANPPSNNIQNQHFQLQNSITNSNAQFNSLNQIQSSSNTFTANSGHTLGLNGTNSKGQPILIKYPQGTILQTTMNQKHVTDIENGAMMTKNVPTFITNNGGYLQLPQIPTGQNQQNNNGSIIQGTNQIQIQQQQAQQQQQQQRNTNLVQVVLLPNDDQNLNNIHPGGIQLAQPFSGNFQLQNVGGRKSQPIYATSSGALDKSGNSSQPGVNNIGHTAILINRRMPQNNQTIQ